MTPGSREHRTREHSKVKVGGSREQRGGRREQRGGSRELNGREPGASTSFVTPPQVRVLLFVDTANDNILTYIFLSIHTIYFDIRCTNFTFHSRMGYSLLGLVCQ
jgi:hypothetical protein